MQRKGRCALKSHLKTKAALSNDSGFFTPKHMTPSDLQSPTWRRFTKDLQLRLQELREVNDTVCTPDKTALIRGQISEVKRLISLSPDSEIATSSLREDEVELPQGDY